MNWLDILLIALIGFSVIGGLAKGLARAGIGFAAVILGLFCGLWFYGLLGGSVRAVVDSRPAANLVAFFLIFFGVVLAGALVGRLVARIFKLARLSWLDRGLGGAFGAVRGVLVAAVVVLAMMAFTPRHPPSAVVESRVAPYVIGGARAIAAAAPHEVKEGFRRSYDRAKEIWAENTSKRARQLPRQRI